MKKKNKSPIILWNHRWEYDKNPELFFKTLNKLSSDGVDFQLAVLGQEFKHELPCFTKSRVELKKHIVQFGHAKSFKDYARWLWLADIIPLTSIQEFFGISAIEATYCKTIPLLPNMLTYPEIFNITDNEHLFYNNSKQLYTKLKYLINNYNKTNYINIREQIIQYEWSNMVKTYDRDFEKYVSKQ